MRGALAVVWLAVTGSVVALSACYGHNCDGDIVQYGRGASDGNLVDEDTWQSGPIDGDWLPFPHERLYIIDLHELGDRPPALVVPYVSASKNPLVAIDNFTIGAGNIAEISGATKGSVSIKNDTCADYFLRVVVQAVPRPPTPVADAGAADATPGDAADQ